MFTLYMVQLGARPKGRLIEQHDIFFGVAHHSRYYKLIGYTKQKPDASLI